MWGSWSVGVSLGDERAVALPELGGERGKRYCCCFACLASNAEAMKRMVVGQGEGADMGSTDERSAVQVMISALGQLSQPRAETRNTPSFQPPRDFSHRRTCHSLFYR